MSSAHSAIQALVELARRDGVEMRPVLLRVLTDLYVQEPVHGPAERARFAELACRLLDSAEPATRAAVAERLAAHPGTPPTVAAKLARDDIAVAAPVLRRSPALDEAALHAILDTCGIAHAVAIAARPDLPLSVAERLRATEEETEKPETDPAVTFTLARRYLAASSGERQRILLAVVCCPPPAQEERLAALGGRLRDRLERAALRHRSGEFVALLHDRLGIARDTAGRIIADPAGEPLAVLCRALAIPSGTASRILLFLNPGAGSSMQQVFALAERLEDMPAAGARRLAAAWCGIGADLRPERGRPVRAAPAHPEPRAPASARRIIRGVTPARPARASES